LETRQPTFLTDPVWQEVPWQRNPKTPFDQIYDFLSLAPELLGRARMFNYLDLNSQLELATDTISKCWQLDHDLLSLYDTLTASQRGPLYWSELARERIFDDDSEDGMVFPVAFHFPNLTVASTVLVYWSIQNLLWQGMNNLYNLMTSLKTKFSTGASVEEANVDSATVSTASFRTNYAEGILELPPLQHRADFATPARNILQSVEYCLQEEMMDLGPKAVAAPLRIAMETLRSCPEYTREVLWAEEAMTKVQERSLRLLIYYTGVENNTS